MIGTRLVGIGAMVLSATGIHGSRIGTDIATGGSWIGMLHTRSALHTVRKCGIMPARTSTKHSGCT
eukprot:10582410-Karenia_brevis.AAC.1